MPALEPGLRANIRAEVSYTPVLQRPLKMRGSIRWQNLRRTSVCIFLPYNDPDFGFERSVSRHMELMGQKFSRQLFLGAGTIINVVGNSAEVAKLSPWLYRVENIDLNTGLEINFESTVPWLAHGDNSDWLYENFYPIALDHCPQVATRTAFYQKATGIDFNADISYPKDWQIAASGLRGQRGDGEGTANISLRANELVFALTRGFKRKNLLIDSVPVAVLYRSDSFLQLLPTLEGGLRSHLDLYGKFPFPDLSVIETSELQRTDLPGILAINKPRQAAFKFLQSRLLNWSHWNLVTLLANQWFGASVRGHSLDYQWLINGFADFAVLEALRQNNKRYNLMNVFDIGYLGLSLNYREAQDLTAALLNRAAPLTELTREDLSAARPFMRQHPLLFIKQSIALRHLSRVAGSEHFANFLRNFFSDHAFTRIKPENVLLALNKLPSPFSPQKRAELTSIMRAWYQNVGWPDFAIKDFTSEKLADGRWVARAELTSKTDFMFNVPIQVEDRSGYKYQAEAKPIDENPRQLLAQVVTLHEPVELSVDPEHHFFDEDRFDNRTGWPSVKFFPGSANSFSDDAYTVVWLPHPLRRPGESFAIGLQAAVFRYLSGSVLLKTETEVADGNTGFLLQNTQSIPSLLLRTNLSLSQNLDGYRVSDITLTRSPLFNWHQNISLGVGARHKQVLGSARSAHQTVVSTFSMRPNARYDFCSYNFDGEYEYAPKMQHTDFSYERRYAVALGTCSVSGVIDLGLRLFRGELSSRGSPSADAYFNVQNLREARLRLDMRNLADVDRLMAASLDVALPFMLPLPDNLLVLNRKTKWRLFHDYGQNLDSRSNYRASGAGIFLPLGGDVSGAGSLTVTQLSLLAVVHSEAEGRTSNQVRLLFDISGEL